MTFPRNSTGCCGTAPVGVGVGVTTGVGVGVTTGVGVGVTTGVGVGVTTGVGVGVTTVTARSFITGRPIIDVSKVTLPSGTPVNLHG